MVRMDYKYMLVNSKEFIDKYNKEGEVLTIDDITKLHTMSSDIQRRCDAIDEDSDVKYKRTDEYPILKSICTLLTCATNLLDELIPRGFDYCIEGAYNILNKDDCKVIENI